MRTQKIGEIGVDAGLCWIGDPCYILHGERTPDALGKDWSEFCKAIGDLEYKSFKYDLGNEGLGVCVHTCWGDGTYPVFAQFNSDGRISKVTIHFEYDDKDADTIAA